MRFLTSMGGIEVFSPSMTPRSIRQGLIPESFIERGAFNLVAEGRFMASPSLRVGISIASSPPTLLGRGVLDVVAQTGVRLGTEWLRRWS